MQRTDSDYDPKAPDRVAGSEAGRVSDRRPSHSRHVEGTGSGEAAAITEDKLGEEMEPVLNALGPRYRLALRVAAARLLEKEKARQNPRKQPGAGAMVVNSGLRRA